MQLATTAASAAATKTTFDIAGIVKTIFAMGSIAILISLALYILLIVAYWKIFTKAGEPGWKSIIPIYNTYTQYKITWEPKFFWIQLALSVGSGIIPFILGYGTIGIILTYACSIGYVVIHFFLANYRLAKSFGYGIGVTIGLLLIKPLFVLILGLGGSEYQGPNAQ